MNELKPCPFCGSKAKLEWISPISEYVVECRQCGMGSSPEVAYKNKEELVRLWNHRPAPENQPLTLDQLRQMEGEPVWTVTRGLESSGRWELIEFSKCKFKGREVITLANIDEGQYDGFADTYGKTWMAYARKPEQEASSC